MTNSTISPPTATDPSISIPGVLVSIQGIGVMLRGPSNIGKSELALSLIDRGHRLVADDVVECSVVDGAVTGTAPAMLADLLELRDLGIINVRDVFGDSAIIKQQKINAIIALNNSSANTYQDRLAPSHSTFELLGQSIPVFSLHHCHTRPVTILVETLVKNWIITQSGPDGGAQLKARLSQTLEANSL